MCKCKADFNYATSFSFTMNDVTGETLLVFTKEIPQFDTVKTKFTDVEHQVVTSVALPLELAEALGKVFTEKTAEFVSNKAKAMKVDSSVKN